MRSARESGCFPYKSKLVCFMEVFPDGTITQIPTDRNSRRDALSNAKSGKSKIVAVWPGQWRSDLLLLMTLMSCFMRGVLNTIKVSSTTFL